MGGSARGKSSTPAPGSPRASSRSNTEKAAGDIPQYLPGKTWGTLGENLTDHAEAGRRRPSRSSTWSCPEGSKPGCSPPSPSHLQADHDRLRPPGPRLDRRDGRLSQQPPEAPWRGARPDLDPRRHGRRRPELDKTTVFADGLSIPTSLAFADGGVIVHQAPDTLFLKDTDGDDKADVRQTLFTGWGTRDTHAGPSNLRYGLDNWMYGIVGYSGFVGTVGGERHEFRQGIYRFKPRRLEARIPPQHQQQLLGPRLQRGRAPVRLDGQQLPERLPADPEPLLRGSAACSPPARWPASPTRIASSRPPSASARSTGSAASPPPPAMPCTRPGLFPKELLEQRGVRRRADRAPRRGLRPGAARGGLRLA